MTDIFTTPDDGGDLKSSDFTTSMTDRLGAQWADTLDPKSSLSGMWIARRAREGIAGGHMPHDYDGGLAGPAGIDAAMQLQANEREARAAIPDISQSDAKDLLKQEGLTEQDVHLGDAPAHKLPVLKMQIDEAHARRDREAAIARGPQGFFPDALGAVTSIGVGMIDPVNAAAFSIPVIGEARMGKILASAGDSILARGAARFGQGAAQGAVGTAALQPADWWLHTRDGQDYTMAQAMESIIMGAGMGGTFHAVHGGLTDYLARREGLPLPGSPQDLLLRGLMTGTHVPASALADEGVPIEEVPGIGPVVPPSGETAPIEPLEPPHPAEVLADLPSPVRQNAVHAAMADIIAGRPTNAAEMLQIAAEHDPRIAESFEAWHGSPHDFDRFDVSGIGTGEGAQAYGHGLYFAENEKVARGYQRATSDKAFVNKVAELYDEGFSPDEAWAEIKDNWKDFTPAEQRLMTALEKDDWLGFDYPHQAVNAALRDIKAFDVSPETAAAARAVGNMYRVKIKASEEHFLDWDKPIDQQSAHVKAGLKKFFDPLLPGQAHAPIEDMLGMHGRSGEVIYSHLASELATRKKLPPDKNGFYKFDEGRGAASKALSEAGVHGIKYLDQGSRGVDTDPARLEQNLKNWRENLANRERELETDPHSAEAKAAVDDAREAVETAEREAREGVKQTRNFVVFDDKHIEITHKNGEPVKKEELIAEHAALQQAKKAPRGRASADPATWSLFEYLASRGGLRPTDDLRSIFGNDRGPFVPGFGPLLRKSGMSIDDALIAAKEGGYFLDPNSQEHVQARDADQARLNQAPAFGVNDLREKIDEESRGRKQYRAGHLPGDREISKEEDAKHIADALHTELEAAAGHSGIEVDPHLEARVVEIIQREGEHDVLAAYERAIIEDEERYETIASARAESQNPADQTIPGWDIPDVAGPPQARSPAPARPGGTAGRARPADGRNAGEPTRTSGPGDRAPAQTELGPRKSSPAEAAADPRWRQLADTTPDYDEPETLAESEAAGHLPEPDSVQASQKSLSALEKAAADAEAVWRQLEPTLTEEERALVNNVMDQLKLDAEARSRIITDGVACLAGAIG